MLTLKTHAPVVQAEAIYLLSSWTNRIKLPLLNLKTKK